MRPALRRTLVVVVVLLLAGTVFGWLSADAGVDATPLVAPAEPWREPRVLAADPGPALARLMTRSPFAADAAAPAPAPEPPTKPAVSWRLSGVIADAQTRVAVILITRQGSPGTQTQYRRVGDELPDGSRLVDIAKTGITVEAGGGRRQVKLFVRD